MKGQKRSGRRRRALDGASPASLMGRRKWLKEAGKVCSSAAVAPFLRLSTPRHSDEMKTEIVEASVEFFNRKLRHPLQLSSGIIREVTEARASVTVRAKGREATGRGSIYLSDLWAWPDSSLSHQERDTALRKLCLDYARRLKDLCGGEPAHPLELGLRLHANVLGPGAPPELARILCTSPLDAALHDAAGIALQRSAFDFYREDHPLPSADPCLPETGACAAIRTLLHKPVRRLEAWWIVGAHDSLEEEVEPAVRQKGYRCFKLKLLGKDPSADVRRTLQVFHAVRRFGARQPRLSLDSNEGNPDAESVREYLLELQKTDAEAFQAVEYLEQPTHRDLLGHPQDWHSVTRLKPVFLDEGLTRAELFPEAVRQGWSGFAVKTCKGHSFSLLAAAWAHHHKLQLTLQDLTNPGLAAIHAALLAAHLPTLNGVELNSPQYTPEANREWLPRLAALLEPTEGVHRLTFPVPPGLGSVL